MPNIAPFHPQLVHFVLALGALGILLRIISLAGEAPGSTRRRQR